MSTALRSRAALAVVVGLAAVTSAGVQSVQAAAALATTSIAQVQGAAQLSPLVGQSVSGVTGVVTARRSSGVYVQDPRGDTAPGWVPGASSAVFVYTGSTPAAELVPGASVSIDATVSEYRPGSTGLSITELTTPTITVVATQVTVPAATLVGPRGLTVPPRVIDNDASGGSPINVETEGTFDPAQDGIDFWESLEGMRIRLRDAQVVGPTSSFGEIPVVPAGSKIRSERGGIVLRRTDPNPERIILDSGLGTSLPDARVGSVLRGRTVGVVDYEFNNFHLMATAVAPLAHDGLRREKTRRAAHAQLSVATFNVENLDPADDQSKFDALARIIVSNLRAPDLLALEEVQDNDGATDSGTVAANQTLGALVDAITAAGGPTYRWRQIDPVNDAEGGEPGGNIRVAFLIRTGTPLRFVARAPGDATTATHVTTVDGRPALTHSPGRVDPGNAAWDAARVPLAGEFRFGRQQVFVVANHWSSKGGDGPLFGPVQPPVQASEPKRIQQARVVGRFVDEILTADSDANVVVLGDLNDFEYSDSVTALRRLPSPDLVDLPATLPIRQRYSYVYEGNSQILDHILLSAGLAEDGYGYGYDIVHVNAEFPDQVSDHDPQIVRLTMRLPQVTMTLRADPARVDAGDPATVAGRLRTARLDKPVAGASVRLQTRLTRADPWRTTRHTTSTGPRGRYTFAVAPQHTRAYRVAFSGDRRHDTGRSPAVRVRIVPAP